jgi:outer membrane protein assembly factor BamB
MRRRIRAACLVLITGLWLLASSAQALITKLTPLSFLMEESQFILTAKVDSIDADKPSLVLTVDEQLKGKADFKRLPVLLKGDETAVKNDETPKILKRVAPKLPLLLFIKKTDEAYSAFAYTNGTWFHLTGTEDDGKVKWSFTHCEPFLRKTFKGPTADLKQVVADVIAGKKKPPAPDDKEKPGLGPEVEPSKIEDRGSRIEDRGSSEPPASAPPALSRARLNEVDPRSSILNPRSSNSAGPLFAVIPSVVISGALGFMAMLFPAVFGGLLLILRRWTAALSVLSINSTLYLAQGWFAPRLASSWWGTPVALWLTMSLLTALGVLWAWRRHVRFLTASATAARFEPPHLGEVVALGVLSALSLVVAAIWLPHSLGQLDLWGKTLLVWGSGLWLATLYVFYSRWLAGRRRDPRPGLPAEGVLLGAMMLTGTGFAVTLAQPEAAETSEGPFRIAWRFRLPEKCWIASSPTVEGDRLYVGAVQASAFNPCGIVYCLDRATGKPIWSFNDGGKMKDVFSSPALADGKVYIGEGFHQDNYCKLYCLDARNGAKLWEFQTRSHTESSPSVARGKVYFGAGDDGLLCLDAASGKELWRAENLHIDANPLVVGDRVYVGSGRGDKYSETVLMCLDADTGEQRWRIPTNLPVWGMAVLDAGRLFVGIGNGNFLASEDSAKPAGAVLCLDAATGKERWRKDVEDGILVRVVVDAKWVYFAARDGCCYCVDRTNGQERWKQNLSSPIVASPALLEDGSGAHLYVAASGGTVCQLDAETGKVAWTFDVGVNTARNPLLLSSPAAVTVQTADGERRRVYFGCALDLNEMPGGILYCLEDRSGGTPNEPKP